MDTMPNSFWFRLLVRVLKHRIIRPECPEGQTAHPLMTRFFTPIRWKYLAVFIHYFHRSDLDEFHDHPWAFFAFLFHSGYWEHTPTGRHWRRRFSVLYRPATWKHYVEIPNPKWTVVIRFRQIREWGFWIHGVWHHWRSIELIRSSDICEYI